MRIALVLALIMLVLSTLVGCGTAVPQAKFSAVPIGGHPPLDVQFTDKSTGNISAWEWDLNGDGALDSIIQNPKYTYESTGNYTVSLTVRGLKGNDTVVKNDYIEVIRCPYLADFIAEPTTGVGVTTVQFTDKSAGNITAWSWDFGDNKTSTEQNPSHIYTKNGNYTVTLTITTPECRDILTKADYISITGCHT